MPTPEALDDVSAALARLEAGGPESANPRRDASEPACALDAVRAWVTARGWRKGAHLSPGMARLGEAFEGYARASGWALDSLPRNTLGVHLKRLGFTAAVRGGVRGVLVSRETAEALWAGVPRKLRAAHRPTRRPTQARPAPLPFHAALLAMGRNGRARPLVDTLGRVWPSARVAAAALPRVNHQDIQAAAKGRRAGVGGVLWRYLTREEVRLVPPSHMSGHVLPVLAWRGTVAAHSGVRLEACPACDARRLADGTPTPSPQDSPGPPANGTRAGGPRHIPAPFSDG